MKQTPITRSRKPIRPVSPKRAKRRRSAEGQAGLAYMGMVKQLPCAACKRHGPCDAHHCKDLPDKEAAKIYERLPAAKRKSGDKDTIPLCREDHEMYHRNRAEFHRRYGFDCYLIPVTRAMLAGGDIDF